MDTYWLTLLSNIALVTECKSGFTFCFPFLYLSRRNIVCFMFLFFLPTNYFGNNCVLKFCFVHSLLGRDNLPSRGWFAIPKTEGGVVKILYCKFRRFFPSHVVFFPFLCFNEIEVTFCHSRSHRRKSIPPNRKLWKLWTWMKKYRKSLLPRIKINFQTQPYNSYILLT